MNGPAFATAVLTNIESWQQLSPRRVKSVESPS